MRNQLQTQNIQTSSRAPLLIGVDMAAGPDSSVIHVLKNSEHEKAHAIRSMVNSIMTLAMLNSDLLHIHASYSAHVKAVEVRVNPASTNYEFPIVLFKEHIYLDKPNALEQLKVLEDLLIELVADAKDLAMGAC